jgi:hypothetical protein
MTRGHIRLVCWDRKHSEPVDADALRTAVEAPTCAVCGSAIWAVEHEGEPPRYVGEPPVPDGSWVGSAECAGPIDVRGEDHAAGIARRLEMVEAIVWAMENHEELSRLAQSAETRHEAIVTGGRLLSSRPSCVTR